MKSKLKLIPAFSLILLSGAALTSILTSCQFGTIDPKASDLSNEKEGNLYIGKTSEDGKDYITSSIAKLKYKMLDDVPYVTFGNFLTSIISENSYIDDYRNGAYIFNIGNSFEVTIDTTKGTMTFDRYEEFIGALNQSPITNNLATTVNTKGIYFSVGENSTYNYQGKTVFDIKGADLDIIADGDEVYLPFSVLNSTIFESISTPFAFNGDDFYLCYNQMFVKTEADATGKSTLSTYGKEYFGGAYSKQKRSKSMADYAYASLCYNFNNFYGFHDKYTNFSLDSYLKEKYPTVRNHLKSTDNTTYETGINELHINVFGDGHTTSYGFSSFYGQLSNTTRGSVTPSDRELALTNVYKELTVAKTNALGENVAPLAIKNKTAIIRFDTFLTTGAVVTTKNSSTLTATESFALFYECFKEIQTHSEVKNVIIDLTTNGGGAADALIATLGFLTNDVKINLDNATTKSTTELHYKVDTNLDGKFDGNDSYAGKYNFYVLTSNFSFSCANLFPTVCKETGCAKIIGEKSGGGACVVRNSVTPDGMAVRMSGLERLNYKKDGKMIDNDDGITPDYELARSSFYDNAKLAEFVESK